MAIIKLKLNLSSVSQLHYDKMFQMSQSKIISLPCTRLLLKHKCLRVFMLAFVKFHILLRILSLLIWIKLHTVIENNLFFLLNWFSCFKSICQIKCSGTFLFLQYIQRKLIWKCSLHSRSLCSYNKWLHPQWFNIQVGWFGWNMEQWKHRLNNWL